MESGTSVTVQPRTTMEADSMCGGRHQAQAGRAGRQYRFLTTPEKDVVIAEPPVFKPSLSVGWVAFIGDLCAAQGGTLL